MCLQPEGGDFRPFLMVGLAVQRGYFSILRVYGRCPVTARVKPGLLIYQTTSPRRKLGTVWQALGK